MSIIPASRLSNSDLTRLGNNLQPGDWRRMSSPRHIERRFISTINRSLARVGECVNRASFRDSVLSKA